MFSKQIFGVHNENLDAMYSLYNHFCLDFLHSIGAGSNMRYC